MPSLADVPGRATPANTSVPNPGTQQQELGNITAPAPFNVFEFVVTCMACHGGTIDQNVGHGGNWAGSSMASAARDPVFRANQLIVNEAVKNLAGDDGAGNMCWRCHSPNGWLSGRFDPNLNGDAQAGNIIQSILLSTDTEGISCEMCHRTMGNVTYKRGDLNAADPAWNMLAGVTDWPHSGATFDSAEGPTPGEPYGDTTLQFIDNMTYGAKWSGSANIHFSDLPTSNDYTGQTYGVYPFTWTGPVTPNPAGMPATNSAGQTIKYNPDGSTSIEFQDLTITPHPYLSAISVEHPTFGGAAGVNGDLTFVRKPEFCGSCHDLTIPFDVNIPTGTGTYRMQGMPEQRTYTEWRFSDFGYQADGVTPKAGFKRCQDCHMPSLKHEYADGIPEGYNPDPALVGWYPYAKDRNLTLDPVSGKYGTAFHKFAGANRDLPDMMTVLYPEVDLEVLGAPTGNDPTVFPGMLSDRSTMWARTKRNTELSLKDAVTVQITEGPILDSGNVYRVKVKVTNNTGHRIPSGYPDGRRFWIALDVKNGGGTTVYQSGYYDTADSLLYADSSKAVAEGNPAIRAQVPQIGAPGAGVSLGSANNRVMIYEKRTGSDLEKDGTYNISVNLLNEKVVFDNRIPPAGYSFLDYFSSGARFVSYTTDGTTVSPTEETTATRYSSVPGQNWDEVTYYFTSTTAPTIARAEVRWQIHTREFMTHLRDMGGMTFTSPRPEGPPSVFELNYPLVPNYLSDVINLSTVEDPYNFTGSKKKPKPVPLNDNWGGIAYASWLLTGRGAPYLGAAAETGKTAPDPPGTPTVTPLDSSHLQISWGAVNGTNPAEGYILWVAYGENPGVTADWDKLAVVPASAAPSFMHDVLNPDKTYTYKVQAFNAAGISADSNPGSGKTQQVVLQPVVNLRLVRIKGSQVTLGWDDINGSAKDGFVIERQEVSPNPGAFVQVGTLPATGTQTSFTFTDKTAQRGRTYLYRIAATFGTNLSPWTTVQVIVK
jgi:Fibronectin type III domain